MQNVAQAWLVYRLTQSSFMLGLVAFCSLAPILLLGLFSGVLADRVNRRQLLIAAHALGMAQAFILAVLTLGGWVTPWNIVVLALVLGVIHALEVPARHSFVAEMVPRHDLSNAIALNSTTFNVARFMGPSLAGWLVALYGEGWVFVINGLSFGAILAGLLAMRVERKPPPGRHGSVRAHILEGLRHAWKNHHIRASLLLIAMISIVAASSTVLMPVFAKTTFRGGSEVMGVLLGAMGVGSLVAALRLARRTGSDGLDRLIGSSGVIAALGLLLFSTADHLAVALPALAVVGFCQTTMVASTNTLIQLLVPDALRGRIMALFSMVFMGLMPLGSLGAGTLAHYLDAPATVRLFALLCLSASWIFLVRAPRFVAAEQVPRR